MKTSAVIALLFIVGVIYFVTGGGALFGLSEPTQLPDVITTPNATFVGTERTNPFAN